VGGARRCRLGRRLQNACDERLAGLGGGAPAAWRILSEAGQALGGDAVPPQAYGLPTPVQGAGNVLVVVALGRQQGHLGAEHEPRRRPPAASPLCELLAFGLCQLKGRGDAQGQILLWEEEYTRTS
jgi:hypothetical protein